MDYFHYNTFLEWMEMTNVVVMQLKQFSPHKTSPPLPPKTCSVNGNALTNQVPRLKTCTSLLSSSANCFICISTMRITFIDYCTLWSFPAQMWSSHDGRCFVIHHHILINFHLLLWGSPRCFFGCQYVSEGIFANSANNCQGNFTLGWENFQVWHLKRRRLTSCENMFCASAFTGRCNRRYEHSEYGKMRILK